MQALGGLVRELGVEALDPKVVGDDGQRLADMLGGAEDRMVLCIVAVLGDDVGLARRDPELREAAEDPPGQLRIVLHALGRGVEDQLQLARPGLGGERFGPGSGETLESCVQKFDVDRIGKRQDHRPAAHLVGRRPLAKLQRQMVKGLEGVLALERQIDLQATIALDGLGEGQSGRGVRTRVGDGGRRVRSLAP